MRIPANYSLPEHLHKIKSSEAFQIAAVSYMDRSAEYLAEVQKALKQQVESLGSEDLAKFETALAEKVLKQAASKMVIS